MLSSSLATLSQVRALMLSLEFVCQHPDMVREALRKRREATDIDDILRLSQQRRALVTGRDGLYVSLKRLHEAITTVPPAERVILNQQIKALNKELRALEVRRDDVESRLQMRLLELPNMPHQSVREGEGDAGNYELRRWGTPLSLHFTPLPHWEIGEHLGIIDAESGVRVAGSRFVTLQGMGARLERALISFMLDIHTGEHGYVEIMPPQLVKRSVMVGAGQLPKFEDQIYSCASDELYLNPTAEVPLLGLYANTILPPGALPRQLVAWTTAFRREVGSAARQHRGLLRLHQFDKIELFQVVEPRASYDVLSRMLAHAENILQRLELPYRVVELCSANLPFASAKTFDLQVWMPGLNEFVEVSSVSNCEIFQARRANIKYRPARSTSAEYVHTLNASGLAVGRTMAALLETYQQADGSVVIPKVLRPYVGASLISC